MIEIIGNELYQWDVGRSVNVTAVVATHVHFANKGDSMAPIMELAEGSANIPDYLLQTGKQLVVYVVANGVTIESKTFSVKKRERPENYVYKDDQRNYIYALIQSAEDATAEAARVAQELTTARANGEFNGPQGPKGDPGYSPVKGKDYFTDADKAEIVEDVLAEIPGGGGGSGADFSWTSLVDVTVNEEHVGYNPAGSPIYGLTIEFTGEKLAKLRKMTEFKMMIRLPFDTGVAEGAFVIRARLANEKSTLSAIFVTQNNVVCADNKTITMTVLSSKIGDSLLSLTRQSTASSDTTGPKTLLQSHNNIFDITENIWFKFALDTKYPMPMGTQIILEGR